MVPGHMPSSKGKPCEPDKANLIGLYAVQQVESRVSQTRLP